jgi:hypothetical protein
MLANLLDCGHVRLLSIEDDCPEDWNITGATHVSVSLPAGRSSQIQMELQGFVFGDRTMDAEIIPTRTRTDYRKMIRFMPEANHGNNEEIFNIAIESFQFDRRFHPAPDYDMRLAAIIIKAWVDNLDETLVCRLHGEIIGFLALKPKGPKAIFIHLAAVREKYRLSGAALSLYAAAVNRSAEAGINSVVGRISTLNTPVFNLYAFLGATFSNSRDVWLKTVPLELVGLD